MQYRIEGLVDFLKASVSTFHAVDAICTILKENGFTALRESACWQLDKGG